MPGNTPGRTMTVVMTFLGPGRRGPARPLTHKGYFDDPGSDAEKTWPLSVLEANVPGGIRGLKRSR
ncbi:hypothetical protein SALBM311S_07373 [Streptomyces alboniger]